MPTHGEIGDLNTYDRTDGNVHVRCVSRLHWCEKCQQWVGGTGIVSMVVASLGCPRCGSPWVERVEPTATEECPF